MLQVAPSTWVENVIVYLFLIVYILCVDNRLIDLLDCMHYNKIFDKFEWNRLCDDLGVKWVNSPIYSPDERNKFPEKRQKRFSFFYNFFICIRLFELSASCKCWQVWKALFSIVIVLEYYSIALAFAIQLFKQIDLSSLLGSGILLMDFFLLRTALWAHTTSLHCI